MNAYSDAMDGSVMCGLWIRFNLTLSPNPVGKTAKNMGAHNFSDDFPLRFFNFISFSALSIACFINSKKNHILYPYGHLAR